MNYANSNIDDILMANNKNVSLIQIVLLSSIFWPPVDFSACWERATHAQRCELRGPRAAGKNGLCTINAVAVWIIVMGCRRTRFSLSHANCNKHTLRTRLLFHSPALPRWPITFQWASARATHNSSPTYSCANPSGEKLWHNTESMFSQRASGDCIQNPSLQTQFAAPDSRHSFNESVCAPDFNCFALAKIAICWLHHTRANRLETCSVEGIYFH